MLGHSLGLDRLLPALFPPHFVTEWAHDETRVVDQVMGAFFFVRRAVFRSCAASDQRFFVYYEDLDFALRARARAEQRLSGERAGVPSRPGNHPCGDRTAHLLFLPQQASLRAEILPLGGALAVIAATLALEPLARMAAAPRAAAGTLRAFARLWQELPAMLRTRNQSSSNRLS